MPGFDYHKLNVAFGAIVKRFGLTMLELNTSGDRPPLPFVAFDVISPYIDIGFQGDNDANAFEAVISLTVYSKSKTDALNTASQIRSSLNAESIVDELTKQEIIVVDRMPTAIRYNQGINSITAMVGFDVRLRLKATPEDAFGSIDQVKLGGNTIGISKD